MTAPARCPHCGEVCPWQWVDYGDDSVREPAPCPSGCDAPAVCDPGEHELPATQAEAEERELLRPCVACGGEACRDHSSSYDGVVLCHPCTEPIPPPEDRRLVH